MPIKDVRPDEIKVGKIYANAYLIREIVEENEEGNVFWRSYILEDGSPTGDSGLCSKQTIRKWADRDATAEEVARLQRQEAQAQEVERDRELAHRVLRELPDEFLIAEVKRRGLVIN
jgi:hypothetical protein